MRPRGATGSDFTLNSLGTCRSDITLLALGPCRTGSSARTLRTFRADLASLPRWATHPSLPRFTLFPLRTLLAGSTLFTHLPNDFKTHLKRGRCESKNEGS